MVQSQPRSRRRNTKPKAATKVDPSSLYVMADFPQVNQEFSLVAAKARVDIVLVPDTIETSNRRTASGELYTVFSVEGITDRHESISFTAQTLPGMPDEIQLTSKPLFF